MLNLVYDLYSYIFSRKIFNKVNKFIFILSLRGLGVLNCKSDKASGEKNFIKNHVSKIEKGVIFDVGANIGSYSKRLREINKNVEIFSFEPHPVIFRKLLENTENLDINIFNVGVGCENGFLNLYDYADKDGSSHASLYKNVIEQIHNGKSVAHEVSIVSLDVFAIEHGIDRIGLLKIDTEGHELDVLKGFLQFIRGNKVDLIHFEFNEMNIVSRVRFKDFWDLLPNYDFFRMLPDGLVPIKNYNPVFCEIYAYQNIVVKLKAEFVRN